MQLRWKVNLRKSFLIGYKTNIVPELYSRFSGRRGIGEKALLYNTGTSFPLENHDIHNVTVQLSPWYQCKQMRGMEIFLNISYQRMLCTNCWRQPWTLSSVVIRRRVSKHASHMYIDNFHVRVIKTVLKKSVYIFKCNCWYMGYKNYLLLCILHYIIRATFTSKI